MNVEERGPWYLLTGLAIGVVLGLIYTWVLQPVEYVDTPPDSLRQDFKDRYRALIAAAFVSNNDLVRAQARLELLHDDNPFRTLSEQAQRTLGENGSPNEARALGLLAIALNQVTPGPTATFPVNGTENTSPVAFTAAFLSNPNLTQTETFTPVVSQTTASELPVASQVLEGLVATLTVLSPDTSMPDLAGTPTETAKPRPSNTQAPPRTSTNTPEIPFVFLSQEEICDQRLSAPLFQVKALDRFGLPAPGVLVIVSWKDGEERFYTGLKPEKGLGYADFSPSPGVVYSLRLGENSEGVIDLSALSCEDAGGEGFWGAWLLKFVQP
jgi:hypothetical protein